MHGWMDKLMYVLMDEGIDYGWTALLMDRISMVGICMR